MDLYFCFDAETDGLFGDVIALGVSVADGAGERAFFAGKIRRLDTAVRDAWCRENVVPMLTGEHFPCAEYDSEGELLEAFWRFWMAWRERCYAVADVAYPVEAHLLRKCVMAKEQERRFLSPYPLIDVSTLLFARGVDPLASRQALDGGAAYAQHNPLEDARMTARLLCKYKGD